MRVYLNDRKELVGNWCFECRSHYWIKRNKIHWSVNFNDEQIARVKQKDQQANVKHYDKIEESKQTKTPKKWYDWFLSIFK